MPQNGLSMFDYYISIGINPYSIGAIGFAGGGGALAANSVSSSNIVDGTVATVDIADGAITEAKFSAGLQTTLGGFADALYDLQNPGYYGRLRIKNNNASEETITILETFYYSRTEKVTLHGSLTLNAVQHHDIIIPIGDRLTNKDTIISLRFDSLPTVTFSGTGFIEANTKDDDIVFKIDPAYIEGVNVEFIIYAT
jgi:hypothetical protein